VNGFPFETEVFVDVGLLPWDLLDYRQLYIYTNHFCHAVDWGPSPSLIVHSLNENLNLLPYVEWDRFVSLTAAQAE
jgi:hypothetical protein